MNWPLLKRRCSLSPIDCIGFVGIDDFIKLKNIDMRVYTFEASRSESMISEMLLEARNLSRNPKKMKQ